MFSINLCSTIIVETCVLKDLACDGSPHNVRSPQPFTENTIVCGSPNEVANTPDAPNKETSIHQFHGGKCYEEVQNSCQCT